MKKYFPMVIIMIIMLMTGCTPKTHTAVSLDSLTVEPAGFFMGLWHGFIALFTFIVSLFNDNVTMYEVHNTPKLYNLGYLIGMMMFWGGGSKGTCVRVRRK